MTDYSVDGRPNGSENKAGFLNSSGGAWSGLNKQRVNEFTNSCTPKSTNNKE